MLVSTIAAVAVILIAGLIVGRLNARPQAARIPVRSRDSRTRRF